MTTLVVHCRKCGQGRILASGHNAEFVTIPQRLEMLKLIGWQSVPEYRCPSCASPMTPDEHFEAIRARMKDEGNTVKFTLVNFRNKMLRKYVGQELKVENWFKNMSK